MPKKRTEQPGMTNILGRHVRAILRHLVDSEVKNEKLRKYLTDFETPPPSTAPQPTAAKTACSRAVEEVREAFADAFGSSLKCGVAVFFLPGTEEPVPLYYGNWPSSGVLTKPDMRKRIEEVAKKLRHQQVPLFDVDPRDIGVPIPETGHFFIWVKTHSGLLPSSASDRWDCGRCGYDGFTVWAKPKRGMMGLKYRLANSVPSRETQARWRCRGGYPPFIGSPVFVNHDTFVLTASFFEPTTWAERRRHTRSFHALLQKHDLVSQTLLLPLYNTILREATKGLRDTLERHHMSPDLLDRIAHDLSSTRQNHFTYYWQNTKTDRTPDSSRPFELADLRAHIYDDLSNYPESLFERVLKIQRDIYTQLVAREPTEAINAALDKLSNSRFVFPADMPFSDLLLRIERAERALQMPHRDHVIHQFQVFLIGALLIRDFHADFLAVFKKELSDALGVGRKRSAMANLPELADYLLHLCWFLSATLHDIGYPVQTIDIVVNEIRGQVGELLHLEDCFLDQQKAARLGIDAALYDDPRTYVLLRCLSEQLHTLCFRDQDEGTDKQDGTWYFLRYLAFQEKHHSIASVIALGLALLPRNSSQATSDFLESSLGKFLCRHVLLPIVLHHAVEWPDIVTRMLGASSKDEKNRMIRDILPSALILRKKNTVRFERLPVATLLAFCDALQETGRPLGQMDAKAWPRMPPSDKYRQCPAKHRSYSCFSLDFDFQTDQNWNTFLNWKRDEIEHVRNVFDLGPLRTICVDLGISYTDETGRRTPISIPIGDPPSGCARPCQKTENTDHAK